MDVMRLIIAQNTRMVIDGPGVAATRVPVDILGINGSNGGTTIDDDFERVENEVGVFLRFRCCGDSTVRRFLYSRSIIDSKTFAPREHEWAIEFDEGEGPGTLDFRGRLYNYDESTVNESKAIEMGGRIRVAD